ncbi:MAG: hypothetical protein HKP17_09690 [Ignavibacteriaceae bacterium]|nr:hypothetical protein [Ignavibacteria bacterium]NNJ53432.1 hypothetical protein [Ignavibacteriaceae bacterium]NNL19827.1 hypothetical protein [Ignavibacteriaceae bacterium]
MKKVYSAILFILLINSTSYAQETYYWNVTYGTRSTLLGGAVIGSVSDLSATYYNPGAVALFEDVQFILSAEVYQYENFTIKDGAAEGLDLNFSTITPSPSFLAFDLDFDFLGTDRLAISLLTRQSADFEFSSRIIDSIDVIGSSPGKESFAGGFVTEKKFDDIWGGVTYSTKLSELVGVGITGYLAYIPLRKEGETILQALSSQGDIASFTNIENYRFNSLRALVKFGIGIDLRPLTLGLTLTSPSLSITGSGSVGTHTFLSGVDSTIFQSNYQDDVKAEYKNPLSVGVGGAYQFGKFNLHLSAEWFDKIDSYIVLDSEPYVSQGSGEQLINDLTHEAKSIINYGLGLDYIINKEFFISAGFTTDFSAKIRNTNTNLSSAANWDVYHISAGATFPIGGSSTTLGISYSLGNDKFQNDVDLTPDPDNPDEIARENEVSFSRIKVLFGFEL